MEDQLEADVGSGLGRLGSQLRSARCAHRQETFIVSSLLEIEMNCILLCVCDFIECVCFLNRCVIYIDKPVDIYNQDLLLNG